MEQHHIILMDSSSKRRQLPMEKQHHIIRVDSSRRRGQLPMEQHHIILMDSSRRRGKLPMKQSLLEQQQIKQKDKQQIKLLRPADRGEGGEEEDVTGT